MPNYIRHPNHGYATNYSLQYWYRDTPSAGYVSPCDAFGNCLGDEFRTAEQRKADALEHDADPALTAGEVVENTYSWYDPGSVRCHCGREHHLARGDSTCVCGQWYNACGQALNPPHMWEEQIDEEPGIGPDGRDTYSWRDVEESHPSGD